MVDATPFLPGLSPVQGKAVLSPGSNGEGWELSPELKLSQRGVERRASVRINPSKPGQAHGTSMYDQKLSVVQAYTRGRAAEQKGERRARVLGAAWIHEIKPSTWYLATQHHEGLERA
jgi:hypothetical protein